MSDPEQRRGGLAERRDSFVQGANATPERRGADAAANFAAQDAARDSTGARGRTPAFPVDGGEMGERIRAHDWAATPLGPIEQWPASLRHTLQMILHSPVPMSIYWGECSILLYNDAMVPMLGVHHPQVLGARALETWPSNWLEGVLRQVLAGESVSLHDQCLETRRSGMREQAWFDLDCSPILDEDGRPRGMLQIAVETTAHVSALAERARLESSLRESESRQRFVLAFNDRVRYLADPQLVMSEAVAALGEHLHASRCGYADVRPDLQQTDVKAEWTDEHQASALGLQSMDDSSVEIRAAIAAGKTFVVRDAQTDSREPVRARAARYLERGARALIGAPLIHHGRWVAMLYVADARVRAWSPAEIGLVEEMAARIWEAVERARAEAALRDNEARLRALFEAVPAAVFASDRDAVIHDFNARAAELWGRTPLRGMDKRGVPHLWSADGKEFPPDYSPVEEVVRSGQAQHLELTLGRADGVRIPVHADYSPLRDAHGEVTGAIVAFNDISVRKRQEAELSLLADIGEVTAHCDGEREIMQAVSSRIGGHLGLHCCCLISVDEAQREAVVDQVWYEGEIPKLPRRAPLSDFVAPAFGEDARAGKPIVVNDCYADPRTDGDAYARYEVGSYISVPWHEHGRWHGLLAFCDYQPREWRSDEIQLVCEVASRLLPRIERARAVAQVRDSEERLRSLINQTVAGIAETDLTGKLLTVNDRFCQMLGYSREELQAMRMRDITHPGDLVRNDPLFEACVAEGRSFEIEKRYIRKDRSEIWVLNSVSAVRDRHGKVRTLVATSLDVTERKRGERDAARLAAIVTSSTDAIISKDLDGIITTWNYGAELLFGYTADEAIGQPVTMLMPGERIDEESGILARVRAGEVIDHYETVRRRKDGRLLDVSLTVAPIHDAQGRIIGASKIARDISGRVQAELDSLDSLIRERNAREEAEILAESARLLSGELEYEELAQKLTDFATRLTGAQFGAFFHNVSDEDGESYMLYSLSGADREAFANMPMPVNSPLFKPTFAGTGVVRSGDVRQHPDYGKGEYGGLPEGHLPVRSYLAAPVVSRSGEVYGGLFFAHANRDMFDDRAERLLLGIAAQAAIALDNLQAYRDVAASEARFRQMIDALPMPVYTTDAEGRLTHFNPASAEFAGRTPTVGADEWCVSWKLYRADGSFLPHDQCPMAMALKQDRPIFGGIEAIAERPDGTRRWFTPYPTPLHDESGKLVGGINMLVDISERKRQEQALAVAEERKGFLLTLTDELRGLRDPAEIQRAVCAALGRRLACDRVYFGEIREDEACAIILPDYHRADLSSIVGRYDLANMGDFLNEMRKSKSLIVDDVGSSSLPPAVSALLDELGMRAVMATLLVRQDKLAWALVAAHAQRREWKPEEFSLLTEVAERTWEAVQRAHALNDLREARERAEQHARMLENTLSSIRDLVFRFAPDGRFDFMNRAMLDVLGVSREQARGKSMVELGFSTETAQTFERDIARVLETRAPVESETPYGHPSTLHGHYTYKLAPIFNAQGEVILIAGTAMDITERKRSEMLIREQNNMLELIATGCELPRCLGELSASVERLDAHTRAAVLLAGEDRKSFEEAHSAGVPGSFAAGIQGAPINELAIGTCGAAVSEGKPVGCADIAHDESWPLSWRELCLKHGVYACYSTPIFDLHGHAIGSFFLAFDRPGEAGAWPRRIAEFGAHVASIAIANTRAEAAVRESEAELAQELADTRLLQNVSTELLSETDPDALYSRIVDAAATLMRADAASLQMFHPERGELRLLAHRGFSEEAARRWQWVGKDSGTTCALALEQGKRIIAKDVRESAALFAYQGTGIRAVQTTPLFARNGKLVGMLSTHWNEPQEPDARRLGLLQVLTRQAADLMENRRTEQKLVELNNFLERRVVERTTELVESERRVRDMASQLTMAEHAERRRISQILHDDLQQQLHSIQMKLASARSALGRGEEAKTLRHLSDAEQWSGDGVETARRLTVDLSPPILKSEGLAEALDWLVTQMREMHGLNVDVSGDRDLQMHDDAKRVLVYQVVRELLFNVVKHAGTDSARIELRRHDDMLDVCVLDEGRGFNPEQLRKPKPRSAGGFGLTSAYERLNLLGGGIEVDSAPGLGTAIVLHVPLRRGVDDAMEEDVEGAESGTEDLFG